MSRKFLVPIATAVSALVSPQGQAALLDDMPSTDGADSAARPSDLQASSGQLNAYAGEHEYAFVLRRNEVGQVMAYHSSHSSHASHSSHRSHYSGR